MGISSLPISSILPVWSGAQENLAQEKRSVSSNPALAGTATLAHLRGQLFF